LIFAVRMTRAQRAVSAATNVCNASTLICIGTNPKAVRGFGPRGYLLGSANLEAA
jgi:hypothetical protein